MFQGGAGASRGGAGVCPERARRLANMTLPVALHAGLFKLTDFQSRAFTQAHDRGRRTRCSHRFFFRIELAPELGVASQLACGLPSARASAPINRRVMKFKEKRIPKEGAGRSR